VAIAIYPITWALFIWYVGKANEIEDEIAETVETPEPMDTMDAREGA
jgi:hypothetical protein